jgi:uncharacterized protein (TIGR02996 family)
MSDYEGILRAILERPGDDLPRLALADWLEENSQAERAEFIRHSIHVPQCSHLALTANDPFPLLGMEPGEPVWVGVPGGEGEARTWMWGETDDFGLAINDLGRDLDYRVDRGFISGVRCRLAAFLAHAGTLFATQPVVEVRVTDKEPLVNAYHQPGAIWIKGANYYTPKIPWQLWSLLDRPCGWSRYRHAKRYASAEDALAALSRACVAYGRSLAGLPPLPLKFSPDGPRAE